MGLVRRGAGVGRIGPDLARLALIDTRREVIVLTGQEREVRLRAGPPSHHVFKQNDKKTWMPGKARA
jgi:hypothetical protein